MIDGFCIPKPPLFLCYTTDPKSKALKITKPETERDIESCAVMVMLMLMMGVGI